MRRSLLIALAVLAVTAPAAHGDLRWDPRPTGSTQGFRGLDAVDCERLTCWASGQGGAVAVLRGG
jgi:hypothetical protein